VNASPGVPGVALNDSEFEAATKEATVSDERADNSRRSLLQSTLVFVQHGSAIREINISGNQVLAALATALCLAGPLEWALVRYSLFAL
jgi:hypothetical protein